MGHERKWNDGHSSEDSLGCETNSFHQYHRKQKEDSMGNMHPYIWV